MGFDLSGGPNTRLISNLVGYISKLIPTLENTTCKGKSKEISFRLTPKSAFNNKIFQTNSDLQAGICFGGVYIRLSSYYLFLSPNQYTQAKQFFSFRQVYTPKWVPPSARMSYFFQTRPKQKTIVGRCANHYLVSIPSQNNFLIRAG